MKRIPAGILLATLAFASPILTRVHADETAEQLSNQAFGTPAPTQDESAAQLSNQDLGPDQKMQDQSASQLSNQDLGPDQKMQDESAEQLSNQDLGPDQKMQDPSAAKIAEKENLEKKPKVVSAPASAFGTGEGVDGVIYAAVAQADGSVLVGGRFDNVNGQPRMNLARFKPDGTLDTKFLAGATDGVDGTVRALALDANGNILVGGTFATAQNQPLQNFVRYLVNGTVDATFAGGQWPNGSVYAITVQPQGQIVIGGEFTDIGGNPRRNLARFNADGTLDGPVASANATTGAVRSLIALPGGGILAAGSLDIVGQTARNMLVAP
jgi:uncharacterized delta-60 repeat protein